MTKKILYYQTVNGHIPLYGWLWTLDHQTKARIEARLKRLLSGNLGDYKGVGDGILELRLHFGPGYRIYFADCGDLLVLLIYGGDKSTQRTDIQLAKFYWEDYKKRRRDK